LRRRRLDISFRSCTQFHIFTHLSVFILKPDAPLDRIAAIRALMQSILCSHIEFAIIGPGPRRCLNALRTVRSCSNIEEQMQVPNFSSLELSSPLPSEPCNESKEWDQWFGSFSRNSPTLCQQLRGAWGV
jgi:hypothetical protein